MIWLYLIVVITYAIAFGVLSSMAVKKKNRDQGNWFVLGFFFGVFGLLAAVLVDKRERPAQQQPIQLTQSMDKFDATALTKQCPDCAEAIKLEAKVCRFCQHKFSEDEVIRQIAQRRQEHDDLIETSKKAIEAEQAADRKLMQSQWECPWCHHLNPLADRRCSRCSGWRPSSVQA